MYSAYIGHFHRVLVPLTALLFLIWTSLIYERRTLGKSVIGPVIVLFLYIALIWQVGKSVATAEGPAAGIEFERVLGLLPLAAACGWLFVRNSRIVMYLRCYLAVGIVTVALAIYEYASNSQVLRQSANSYVRNGHTRAVVGADHPLVLAALLLGLIPVAMYVLPRWRRVTVVWLFVGVLATGSNGPSAIGALLVIVCLVPPVARLVTTTAKPMLTFCVGLFGFIAVGAFFLWTNELPATNVNKFSNEYRAGLYHLLPGMLSDRPLGYGLAGMPHNTYFFSTAVGGIKDVAASIDSELVYSASQYGLIGVGIFLFALGIGIFATVKHQALGLSFFAITLAGFFLALHSWDSLGSYWFLFGGACAAVVFDTGGATRWRGLDRGTRAVPLSRPGVAESDMAMPEGDSGFARVAQPRVNRGPSASRGAPRGPASGRGQPGGTSTITGLAAPTTVRTGDPPRAVASDRHVYSRDRAQRNRRTKY